MEIRSIEASSKTQPTAIAAPRWNRYLNELLAREVSSATRYYDGLFQVCPRPTDAGFLLSRIDCAKKEVVPTLDRLPVLENGDTSTRIGVLLNGNVNHDFDIQKSLIDLRHRMSRFSRVFVVAYNPYLAAFYRLANRLGIRKGELPSTFITETDLANIAVISGFEVVRIRPVAYSPWRLMGIGSLLNRVLPAIPFFRWFSWATVISLRPANQELKKRPSISVIIPARNEKGNIANALERMPDLGAPLEVVFVEGHSTDHTWEEILRVAAAYKNDRRFVSIQCHRQTGKGKSDAVRIGFSKATCDVLTILDADLTMPPELLGRFFNAFCEGKADFVNGTRLVYPMEGEAMRFLNRLGNIFFAKALSFVLDTRLGDSLCGTKLLLRRDYDRFIKWRNDFGDVDPFGDFELLFPASVLALGIVDIPIRYRARTYGSTNISRFRHGFILLKMTLIGLFGIKFGRKN